MATKQVVQFVTNAGWAQFLTWAGPAQASNPSYSTGQSCGINGALAALGFTAVTDPYSANGGTCSWAGGTTNSVLSNPNVMGFGTTAGSNLFGTTFPAVGTNNRAGVPAANFLGTWAGGTAYTIGQVVTYTPSTGAAQCFICWATGGVGIAPASAASSTTYWSPYWFEIWSMPSSGLVTVYIKLEYGQLAVAADPCFSIQFSTTYNSAGCISASGQFSTVEQCMGGAVASASSIECDFASDGQNWFTMYIDRGTAGVNTALFFERAISGTTAGAPVYSTGTQYLTYGIGMLATTWHQCSLFLSTVGTPNSVRNTYLTVPNLFVAASQIVNNVTPALPVFPLVGWLGNPTSVACAFAVADVIEGATVSITAYGAAHNYLVSKLAFIQQLGGTASIFGLGLRWE
jgi:hypothetical protein